MSDSEIRIERGKVYGDPKINHRGIAMQWAPILQPWSKAIANMEPLPEHVVALLMVSLKINRMRHVYHEDNFADMRNYAGFAQAWQEEHGGIDPTRRRKPVVYISHPYSSDPAKNVRDSCVVWDRLRVTGAMIPVNPLWSHVQHQNIPIEYEDWMDYDIQMIESGIFDAILRVPGKSNGADREVEVAAKLRVPIFTDEASLIEWCRNA